MKNITQKELAKGICSVSYLSKIENNVATPHHDVTSLLFEKLDISLKETNQEDLQVIKNSLVEWYELIKGRYNEESKEIKNRISEAIKHTVEPSIIVDYHLYLIRYYLLLLDLDNASIYIDKLKFLESRLNQKQKYYFYLFYALYMYSKNDLISSLEYCNVAENIDKELSINETELYFLLALTHSRLHHVTMAITYSLLTLDKFDESLDYAKSIETRIILAINYIRIKDFDKAEFNLINSLKIAQKINSKYLTGNIHHNLGYLYSNMKENEKAILYYKDSLKYKAKSTETYLNTVYYLAKELITIGNLKDAKKLIIEGIKFAKEIDSESNLIKLETLKYLVMNDISNHKKYLEENTIPYFTSRKNWIEVSQYADDLANIFFEERKYKNSSHYYQLAYEALKKTIM